MRHLFLAESDYAASGAAFMLALQRVNEDVRYLAARPHIYQYPHQPKDLIPRDHEAASRLLSEAVEWAQWVWIIQSDLPMKMGGTYGSHAIGPHPQRDAWMERLTRKRVALLHGGGHYRDNREFYQQLWAPLNPLSLCYEADLMGSFEDEHLVVPPLSPDWVPQRARTWGGLRIGHYPSRPTDKGSEWIVPMLSGDLRFEFRTSVTDATKAEGVARVPWPQQLERMADCDVIVDQIKPALGSHTFGEWVSIATETAMMGRIPIANSLNPKPYRDTYGCDPGLHVCNTVADLANEVSRLSSLTDSQIRAEQSACRQWAESHHSLRATGRLLLDLTGIGRPAILHPIDAERLDMAQRATVEACDGTIHA